MSSSSAIAALARGAVLFTALCLAPCSLFAQAPKLITYPSPPPANQPFDGELSILALPEAIGPTGSSPAFVGDGYFQFNYDTCNPNGCSISGLQYRSFPLHFPPLTAGTYDVQFWPLEALDIDPPPPPMAELSMRVGAAPSSVPALSVPAVIIAAASLTTLTQRALQNGEGDS